MPQRLKPQAKRLVDELMDKLHLSPVDAHRGAFVVLAVHKGWPKARIGRWLGISRARVGQRVAKYERYAATESGAFPELVKLLKNRSDVARDTQRSVAFSQDEWEDPAFAIEMLNRLS